MTALADGLSHPAAAVVAHIVSETLQCAVRRVVPILGYGQINTVFRVDTTTAPLIVRLNQLEHLATYQKEHWCLLQAAQHGIPVPTILAVGTAADRAYMIQAAIPGTSGATADVDASQVWRRLGAYAARANQIPVQGYGGVMDPDQPGAFTSTWKQLIDELVTAIFRDD